MKRTLKDNFIRYQVIELHREFIHQNHLSLANKLLKLLIDGEIHLQAGFDTDSEKEDMYIKYRLLTIGCYYDDNWLNDKKTIVYLISK